MMILKTKSLLPPVLEIVMNKSTEIPFSGEYHDFDQAGSYLCRQCGLALFSFIEQIYRSLWLAQL